METVQLDPERQKKAREYSRLNRRLMVAELALSALVALVWLVSGWSAGLRTWLERFSASPWLLVLLYAAVFGAISFLVDLPLSYFAEYILPHRFGQSNETLSGWVTDQAKNIGIGAVLGGIVLEMIYAVLRAFPETWWIWAAAILLLFSVLLANLAPVLLFPIFYRFVPLGDEYAELKERLARLFERAGRRVKGVYQFDLSRRTKSANAALTGLGATRRIILGDTLIREFSLDEIETVLAHELGHHVNQDIPFNIAVQTLSTVAGLYIASLGLKWGSSAFGLHGPADIAALPLFLLVMGVYGLVTMPLTNAFSRWRERKADQYALETTRNPVAFASAMTRLANQNLSEVDPETWVELLLYSHPALHKRIQMAQSYQTGR